MFLLHNSCCKRSQQEPGYPLSAAEAEKIAEKGIKEIVLTGVNIGDYGKTTGESFVSLVKELINVDGIERYRISSIEPDLLTDELISLTAESRKIMPHFIYLCRAVPIRFSA